MSSLVVLTPLDPAKVEASKTTGENDQVKISFTESAKDALDQFNHPRLRRALIVSELSSRSLESISFHVLENPLGVEEWKKLYEPVHSTGLLEFLVSAWSTWIEYRDDNNNNNNNNSNADEEVPLVAMSFPLLRELTNPQRMSNHPVGQMGYYCTDKDTPVFGDLLSELLMDGALITEAVETASIDTTVYSLVTHPGHHSSVDCFGGYCYVNHVAAMAQQLKQKVKGRVAILDVDYHVGNGTAAIFYSDPSVFVCSIHCDPAIEYPFHSGYADERGTGPAEGTTLHIPLPAGTLWDTYSIALERGLAAIREFGPQAFIVSMGLDTLDQDPVTLRRAGFGLEGEDYIAMGSTIAKKGPTGIPVIFLQEGGYRMDRVAQAATDIVTSFCHARGSRGRPESSP